MSPLLPSRQTFTINTYIELNEMIELNPIAF